MGLALLLLAATAAARPSLAERVNQAVPGAVIHVLPGVHHVNLHITRPLTLLGEPGAILDGDGHGDVIRIAASGVTLRHLVIRHSGTDLTDENAGIFVEQKAQDVTLADNTLKNILFGIYLDGPANVRVIHNRISGIASLRRQDRGDAIHLWNDHGVLVRDNAISGTRDGIYIYMSPHNRIIGNHIHDVRYGIHWMYSNDDVAADNATDHTLAGYALMQSRRLVVSGNSSSQDADYGILMNYVTYSQLIGNRITGVTGERDADGRTVPGGAGKGLFVYNSEYNVFRGNRIRRCPIGIHITAGSDQNRIYGNAFVYNRVQVKYVQNYQEQWSYQGEGNYWSDYLGWDLDGNGRGDRPYRPNDGVDVLLWKYPSARLLMNSPAILALRYIQRAFPVFTPPGIMDSYPLMKPPPVRPIEITVSSNP